MGKCVKCGMSLTRDDIGLFKKLICRYADRNFCCKQCIASELKCGLEVLDRKIEEFKACGCIFFQ